MHATYPLTPRWNIFKFYAAFTRFERTSPVEPNRMIQTSELKAQGSELTKRSTCL